MRLINVHTLTLESFTNDVPQYAILSHTWIKNQEVTLQAMEAGGPARDELKGWEKIVACCERATRDGWHYVWIDTCCIDKTDSVELSEAINSMFRWYEEAVVCYAYLADVVDKVVLPASIVLYHENKKARETVLASSIRKGEDSDCRDESRSTSDRGAHTGSTDRCHFDESRWFERGWTLQELLAPRAMLFFNKHWKLLGTRDSLVDAIADITGIDRVYLATYGAFRSAPVAAIFSWAAPRQTERIEDQSYSLLGLFGIHMPLIYGEGHAAFWRLQTQILQERDDETIFAWHTNAWASNQTPGFLAKRPADFRGCGRFACERRDIHRDGGVTLSKGQLSLQAGLYKRCTHSQETAFGSDFVLITNCHAGHALKGPYSSFSLPQGQLLFRLYHDQRTPKVFHFSKAILETLPKRLPKPPDLKTFAEGTLFQHRHITVSRDPRQFLAQRGPLITGDVAWDTAHDGHTCTRDRLTRRYVVIPPNRPAGSNMIFGGNNAKTASAEPRGLVLHSNPPSDPNATYVEIAGEVYEPIPPMALRIAYPLLSDPRYSAPRHVGAGDVLGSGVGAIPAGAYGHYTSMAMQLHLPTGTKILRKRIKRKSWAGHGSTTLDNTGDNTGNSDGPDALHPAMLTVSETILLKMRVPLPDSDKDKDEDKDEDEDKDKGIYTLCLTLNGQDPIAQYGLWSMEEDKNAGRKLGRPESLSPQRTLDQVLGVSSNEAQYLEHIEAAIGRRSISTSMSTSTHLPQAVVHPERGCRVTVLQWPLAAVSAQIGFTLCIEVRVEVLDAQQGESMSIIS